MMMANIPSIFVGDIDSHRKYQPMLTTTKAIANIGYAVLTSSCEST